MKSFAYSVISILVVAESLSVVAFASDSKIVTSDSKPKTVDAQADNQSKKETTVSTKADEQGAPPELAAYSKTGYLRESKSESVIKSRFGSSY